jgi:hypothetical membrane protein
MRQLTASLGICAVALFGVALTVFALLNPNFDPMADHISKLGAKGEPFALGWNLVGFLAVGAILAAFGWAYGRTIQDRTVRVLFTLFGVGFAATGVPIDMADSAVPMSKAHVVAICVALAAWLLGLACLAGSSTLAKTERLTANVAAIVLIASVAGHALGFWAMPLTQRLVFGVVFGWVTMTSAYLLWGNRIRD